MTSFSDHRADQVQAALLTDMTIDITTTGRKSGEPRRIEIWFLNVDGAIYITGTPGARDWYANLTADSSLIFHLKESTTADLAATAIVVTSRDERARVFATPRAGWYLQQGDSLDSLLDDAPMVRLQFDS